MRLVMSTNSIVDDLKFFGCVHIKPRYVSDTARDLYVHKIWKPILIQIYWIKFYLVDEATLFTLQPSRFWDAIRSRLQSAGYVILDSRSLKLDELYVYV